MLRASPVDPSKTFHGVVVMLAPHMDDEILACGGTIASLPNKNDIYFVYAADGSKSPVPILPWSGAISTDLTTCRMQEAKNALNFLKIPEKNIIFLNLPDRRLKKHRNELAQKLTEIFADLKPVWVMIPFRFDRHPDHIALNKASHKALSNINQYQINIAEYFIYYRWRLLAGGDIRKSIRSDHLWQVDIKPHSAEKKKALQFYKSQTTLFFPWQDRPILPDRRVDEVSKSPEFFVKYNPKFSGTKIFQNSKTWIRIVHSIEPPLKNIKDKAITLLRKGLQAISSQ